MGSNSHEGDVNEDFAPDRPEFFLGDTHAAFRRLRREDPLPWYEGSGGAWCVLKHADVVAVSRDPRRFTSTATVPPSGSAHRRSTGPMSVGYSRRISVRPSSRIHGRSASSSCRMGTASALRYRLMRAEANQ